MLIVIQILLALDWAKARFRESIDTVHPLAASSTDITGDNHTKGGTVNLRKGLAVHLPSQQNLFIIAHFAPRDRYSIVVDFKLPGKGS